MECFIVRPEDVSVEDSIVVLRDDEAHHALRSLRLKAGEQFIATDLQGTCYQVELSSGSDSGKMLIAEGRILKVLPEHHESASSVIIAQAILQQPSRFEEIFEKATELGIGGFIPIITERTGKKNINPDRIDRILREATKQVSRARKPFLQEPMAFREALSYVISKGWKIIVLHEGVDAGSSLKNNIEDGESYCFFIGPEGGFTDEEIDHAARNTAIIASLGKRRLRADTAAIACAAYALLRV
jgi:16S rRNA (uracil1498-N3)-methyltransferase